MSQTPRDGLDQGDRGPSPAHTYALAEDGIPASGSAQAFKRPKPEIEPARFKSPSPLSPAPLGGRQETGEEWYSRSRLATAEDARFEAFQELERIVGRNDSIRAGLPPYLLEPDTWKSALSGAVAAYAQGCQRGGEGNHFLTLSRPELWLR